MKDDENVVSGEPYLNAPKCPNRAMWKTIKLLDARGASTNGEMFDAISEHLSKAAACRVTECYCTCFRPQTPGTADGPRVWNEQVWPRAPSA